MSEKELTREQVEHLVCDGGDDSAELYLAHDAQQREEIKRLSDLLWGARCVYCGEIVGKDRQNQELADAVLRKHVLACHKHPVAAMQTEIEQFKGIFGVLDEQPRTIERAREMWDRVKTELEQVKLDRDVWKQSAEAHRSEHEHFSKRCDILTQQLSDSQALRAELEKALNTIAGYAGENGCCPYGCDTPYIAQCALTPTERPPA